MMLERIRISRKIKGDWPQAKAGILVEPERSSVRRAGGRSTRFH